MHCLFSTEFPSIPSSHSEMHFDTNSEPYLKSHVPMLVHLISNTPLPKIH
ncbi:hypothetical protein KC19_6G013800 [Ceratodon purpureus]|uniref:Uncharacterized protein n=1 Tax=Ceratodon purpureus TaxID=3225 RepID=A0A8T0HD44_CERPU|nr:hypothetical protein KC19_6G013800 [Ceratodon purpureus]